MDEKGGFQPFEIAETVLSSDEPAKALKEAGVVRRPVRGREFQGRQNEIDMIRSAIGNGDSFLFMPNLEAVRHHC